MKTQALATTLALGLLISGSVACGGSQSTDGGKTPGQTHSTRTISDGADGTDEGIEIDAPLGSDPVPPVAPGAPDGQAAVTFVITVLLQNRPRI